MRSHHITLHALVGGARLVFKGESNIPIPLCNDDTLKGSFDLPDKSKVTSEMPDSLTGP
jgi:hypothetical protein